MLRYGNKETLATDLLKSHLFRSGWLFYEYFLFLSTLSTSRTVSSLEVKDLKLPVFLY